MTLEDEAKLVAANAMLKELLDMDMSGFSPQTLVEIQRLATEAVKVAAGVKLVGLRELGFVLCEAKR